MPSNPFTSTSSTVVEGPPHSTPALSLIGTPRDAQLMSGYVPEDIRRIIVSFLVHPAPGGDDAGEDANKALRIAKLRRKVLYEKFYRESLWPLVLKATEQGFQALRIP